MKLRILKVLSKPKAAIGVSLLDVISNALASIILLFFVFAALRGQPLPPERVLGILIIDYKFNSVIDTPLISIYVNAPSPQEKGVRIDAFDSELESKLPTGTIDSIPGIWESAIVLTTPGKEKTTRRFVFMNPTKGLWTAGAIFADHSKYTRTEYLSNKSNSFEMKAYFINPDKGTKRIILNDTTYNHFPIIEYPTQRVEMDSFYVADYNF